jgi:hypothetical protein
MSQSSDRDNFPALGSQEGVEPRTPADLYRDTHPKILPANLGRLTVILDRLDALVPEFADIT